MTISENVGELIVETMALKQLGVTAGGRSFNTSMRDLTVISSFRSDLFRDRSRSRAGVPVIVKSLTRAHVSFGGGGVLTTNINRISLQCFQCVWTSVHQMLYSTPNEVHVTEPNFSKKVDHRFHGTVTTKPNRQPSSEGKDEGGNECQVVLLVPLKIALAREVEGLPDAETVQRRTKYAYWTPSRSPG